MTKYLFLLTPFMLAPMTALAISLNSDDSQFHSLMIDTAGETTNPWASTTITQKTIRDNGARSIPEAMKLIPGFVNARPFGSYELAVYGGLQDEYPRGTRIEINDVPVNLASTGSIFWESLPVNIEDVQRITFISSPSSSINGDQAFNGIIKIYTFSADEQNSEISASAAIKSFRRGYVRLSEELSETLSAQLSISHEQGDGKFEEISTENRYKLWASLIHKPNSKNIYSFDYGFGTSHDDETAATLLPYVPNYADRKISSQNIFFTWNNSDQGNLRTTLGIVTASNDIENVIGGGSYLFDIKYYSVRKFGSIEFKDQLSDSTSYRLSAGIRVDDEEPGKFARTTDSWHTETTEFSASLDHQFDSQTQLHLSGSYNTHSTFNSMTAFSSAVTKRIDNEKTISLLYSQGFRYPVNWESRSEHYLTPVNNPNLYIVRNDNNPTLVAPEKVENVSVKFDYSKNQDNKVSLVLFHKRYEDLIYQQFVPYGAGIGLYSGNVLNRGYGERISTTGIEVHSVISLGKKNSLLTSYAFNSPIISDNNVTNMENTIPAHVLTAMLSTKLTSTLSMSLTYSYVSEMNWIIDKSEEFEKETKPYSNASVELRHCDKVGRNLENLCLSGFARNILPPSSTFYNSDMENGVLEDLQIGAKLEYKF